MFGRMIVAAVAITIFSFGCCTKEEPKKTDTSATVGDVIDYAIGKTPIEQGERMKKEIKAINQEHNDDAQKVLDEMNK